MKNNENQKNVCCMLSKWAFLFLLCVMFTLGTFAQDRTVKGTVLDPMGEAIIGANVMVKGTANGTITDIDGNFSLSVSDDAKFLEISFIGYETTSVVIPQSNIIKITLKESSVVLDEVVAIGYGVQKKGSVTGAIAKVNAEKLGDRPISDVSSALQGQMAGVEIRTTSGEPGKDIQIRVRGAASINADSDPLYVVDGIPVDNLNSLNPSDIESIEVLKDASSSAIYGSRGANGVVLVTTKKGKEGKIKVEFSANVGLQQLERKMDLLSAEEWIEAKTYYNNTSYVQKYAAQGATINDDWDTRKAIIGGVNYSYMLDPRWTEANYGGLKLIDWQDEFYRTALMQDYQVSVSGGTQKTNYRFSVGYLDQEGIATGTDYSRLNLRTNIESQVSDRIKIGLNIAPSVSWSNGGRVDGKDSQSHIVLSATPVAEPEAGLYTGAEPYERYMWAGGAVSPIAYMEESTNATDIVRINASAYLQADLGQGFKAEITGAWNYFNKENRSFVPSSVTKTWNQGEGLSTTASKSNDRSNDIMLQALLHYNREFGKHTIGAMLGYSMEESKGSSSSLKAKQFPNNSLEVFDMSFATISGAKADLTTPVRLLSYFGRVQYDYAAMMTRMMEIREIPKVVGIDIGGFTSDYLLMRSGRPDMDYCDSLEKGVITMYNDIISSINSEYDMLLEEADIDSIIKGKTQYYEEAVVQAVETMVQNFVTDLLNSIRERGIDTKSTYTVFIGGGAVLLERFLEQADRLGKHTFIRDMKANADGYDLLYRMTQAGV